MNLTYIKFTIYYFICIINNTIQSYNLDRIQRKVSLLHLKLVSENDYSKKSLEGKVACVTGGSRGIGKGIVKALTEQGAIVYVTGRSMNDEEITEKSLGGTLSSLANEINDMKTSGRCIPVQVDHKDDSQVKQLFELIEKNHGRLDILVNNAFQVPNNPNKVDKELLFHNFWEQPGWFWDPIMDVGLRSHYISSCYAVPLLQKTVEIVSNNTKEITKSKPLIIHISSFGGVTYSFNVAYGVGKAAVDRMAKDMHVELLPYGIRCISIYPGIVRTERMKDILDSGEWETRSDLATPNIFIESPILTGQAIAALYANNHIDNYLDQINGQVCVTAEIAKRYQLIDPISLITPPSIRSLKFLIPSIILSKLNLNQRKMFQDIIIACSPDILLPMSIMAEPRIKQDKNRKNNNNT